MNEPMEKNIFYVHFNYFVELEKIVEEIKKGRELEEILKNFDWKFFENFVREIFEVNNFSVIQNFVFKTNRRYEIDLVASRGDFLLCVDCKSWASKGSKKSKLKEAAKKQEKRVDELKKFVKKNLVIREKLKIKEGSKFKSIIVTLLEEDLINESKSLIVPIFKLNNFLVELEKNFEEI
jgi:Holliday junction resolvase-like predicted endonuclease